MPSRPIVDNSQDNSPFLYSVRLSQFFYLAFSPVKFSIFSEDIETKVVHLGILPSLHLVAGSNPLHSSLSYIRLFQLRKAQGKAMHKYCTQSIPLQMRAA